MSWLICGTIPERDLPLLQGKVYISRQGGSLVIEVEGRALSIARGTPALAAAASAVCAVLGIPAPELLAAGDIGAGQGSRDVYAALCAVLPTFGGKGITFHYLLPDVDWQTKVLAALPEKPPCLVADAGYMYAAKMSGYAASYDLFTPDAGELAFLADENAPHPFYTRGFLLAEEAETPALLDRAAGNGGAAKAMLVKGSADYYVEDGKIAGIVNKPCIPYMEAIGGTGDTVTGIISALLFSGMPMREACLAAARTNRVMGALAKPTPATQIAALVEHLPEALESVLSTFPREIY